MCKALDTFLEEAWLLVAGGPIIPRNDQCLFLMFAFS
jgi:hypothetical protein